MTPTHQDNNADTGLAARLAIRGGTHRGGTSGMAGGYVQGNLAILPKALAADFLRFSQLNPKPCPIIGTSAPGDAFAAVKYRDYWYWIDDRDYRTKGIFTFLMIIMTLSEKDDKVPAPVVTIPAN